MPDEIVALLEVSLACSVATFVIGLAVSVARWRRPDLRLILAYAVAAPLTVPVIGGLVMAITLLPIVPLFGAGALVTGWDLLPILTRYIIFGIYAYGLAVQTLWFWAADRSGRGGEGYGLDLGGDAIGRIRQSSLPKYNEDPSVIIVLSE